MWNSWFSTVVIYPPYTPPAGPAASAGGAPIAPWRPQNRVQEELDIGAKICYLLGAVLEGFRGGFRPPTWPVLASFGGLRWGTVRNTAAKTFLDPFGARVWLPARSRNEHFVWEGCKNLAFPESRFEARLGSPPGSILGPIWAQVGPRIAPEAASVPTSKTSIEKDPHKMRKWPPRPPPRPPQNRSKLGASWTPVEDVIPLVCKTDAGSLLGACCIPPGTLPGPPRDPPGGSRRPPGMPPASAWHSADIPPGPLGDPFWHASKIPQLFLRDHRNPP